MRFKIFTIKMYLVVPILVLIGIITLSSFKTNNSKLHNLTEPKSHVVTIFRMKYNPANINVRKGDTVIWINKDFVPHDVTEETSQKWTSKPFQQGEKWYKVIQEDTKYFCNLHKVMKGTISITQ